MAQLFSGIRLVKAGTSDFTPSSTGDAAVTVNLLSGQTGAALQINDSTATSLARIDKSGNLTLAGTFSGSGNSVSLVEGVAPAGVALSDIIYADSTAHRLKMNNNNGTADTVLGAATTDTLTNKSLTSAKVVTAITANTAGADALGTAALPFGSLVVGTAATNVFTVTPAVAAAARAITLADPGGAATLAFTNPTSAQTLAGTSITLPAVSTLVSPAAFTTGGTAPTTKSPGFLYVDPTQANLTYVPVLATPVQLVGSLAVNITPVTANANVTTAQNLMAFTLPANAINVLGKLLRLSAAGVYTTQAAQTPTITLAVKIGAVTVISWVSQATTASATNMPWEIDAYIPLTTTGALATVEAHGMFNIIDTGTSATAAIRSYNDTNTGNSGTFDATAANVLQVTVTFSTNAAGPNTCTQRLMILELLN